VSRYVLSKEAIDDLELIWAYIAQDNPEAADRVIEAAYQTCRTLADHPELGRLRHFSQNVLTGLRSFVVTDFPNYVIFYRVQENAVQIVRVLHGARDIEKLFDGP
jgi:toxin ParE1/3/4